MTVEIELQVKQNTKAIEKNTVAVDKITKAVFGNGEIGMDESVRNLNTTLTAVDTKITDYILSQEGVRKRKESFEDKVKLVIIGLVATNILALFVGIVKIYPTVVLLMEHVAP